jgi:hypothetical protein
MLCDLLVRVERQFVPPERLLDAALATTFVTPPPC